MLGGTVPVGCANRTAPALSCLFRPFPPIRFGLAHINSKKKRKSGKIFEPRLLEHRINFTHRLFLVVYALWPKLLQSTFTSIIFSLFLFLDHPVEGSAHDKLNQRSIPPRLLLYLKTTSQSKIFKRP
jgi:hypothetical protein